MRGGGGGGVFFFQAEDGIRDYDVTGVQTCALPIFCVPKFLPDGDGGLGERNSVNCVSIEKKMGLHSSPTCVLDFDGAKGWLVGEEHTGMALMFEMMNRERL